MPKIDNKTIAVLFIFLFIYRSFYIIRNFKAFFNTIGLSRELSNTCSWGVVLWTLNRQVKIFLRLKPVVYSFLILWLCFPIPEEIKKEIKKQHCYKYQELRWYNIILVQNLGKKIWSCLYDQIFQTFSNLILLSIVGLVYA